MTEQQIKDKFTKVCICKSVSRLRMKQAILDGCDTVEKVWKATYSGNGNCKGKRCGPKIQELIDEYKAGLWTE